MGTETDILVRPCQCGQGEFEIQRSTPDHPFARDYSPTFHGIIRCVACQEQYSFGPHYLHLRADVVAKEEALAAWSAARKALETSSDAIEIRKLFADQLNLSKTKKAAYELLSKHGLVSGGYGNFTRKYAGGEMLARSLTVGQFGKVLDMLDWDFSAFKEGIAHVEGLWKAVPQPSAISSISALSHSA